MTHSRQYFRLLILALASQGLAWPVLAKSQPSSPADHPASAVQSLAPVKQHSPYRAAGHSAQTNMYYQISWGIDNLRVQRTASGNLIRFSYRVTDVERAKSLSDKQASPQLVDPQRGVMLVIPVMEKIGALRQTGAVLEDRVYWMIFSNKGDVVKAGDRVDVLIGSFHADGLVVE